MWKQFVFYMREPLLGTEHCLLPFLELRRGKTLGVRKRLPPLVIVRYARNLSL